MREVITSRLTAWLACVDAVERVLRKSLVAHIVAEQQMPKGNLWAYACPEIASMILDGHNTRCSRDD
jgi:hypothetical protein